MEKKRERILERKSEALERASERASSKLEAGMNADEEKMIKTLCDFSACISSEMVKEMFHDNMNILAEIKFDHHKFELL